MMPSAFAAVLGPVTGSNAPTGGVKAGARREEEASDFAAALGASEAADAPIQRSTPSSGPGVEDKAAPQSTPTEPTDPAVDASDAPVSAQPLPLLPTPLPLIATSEPAAAKAGGAGELEIAPAPIPGPAENVPAESEDRPTQPASADPLADAKTNDAKGERAPSSPDAAPKDRVPQGADAASGPKDSAIAPAPAPAADAAKVPPSSEPRLVTPSASDRARDVASVSSAVVTPLRGPRPAPSAQPATPAAPAAEDAPEATETTASPEPASQPPVDPGRVRDVIERATTRGVADQNASARDGQPASDPATDPDLKTAAATPARPTQNPGQAPALLDGAAIAPAVMPIADEPVTTAATTPTGSTESRPAEVLDTLGLSTLSRVATETTAQIAAQIVRKLEGRSTRFEMALTPDDLGRVDVSLDIDADGGLVATLAFDNPAAATELRGRADELRRQLLDAGFTLADDALSFSERDPSAGQGGAFDRQSDPRNARAFGAASRLTAEADLATQPASWISLSLTPQGVDMKV